MVKVATFSKKSALLLIILPFCTEFDQKTRNYAKNNMKITPLELRQFEFEKTFRGYSIEEVDMFINNLAQEWERVLTETKMMRMQLELAEKEAAKLREIELTLFKTLKTAEDTSTMITEQANQQAAKNISEANRKAEKQVADAQLLAEKYVGEAKMEAEKILSDARIKANETIQLANQQATYVKENVLSDVKAIESDFHSLVNYKEQLLTQMRGFASATIDHVERFEARYDLQAIEHKLNDANQLVGGQEDVVENTNPLTISEIDPEMEFKEDETPLDEMDNSSDDALTEQTLEIIDDVVEVQDDELVTLKQSEEIESRSDIPEFSEETIEEAIEMASTEMEMTESEIDSQVTDYAAENETEEMTEDDESVDTYLEQEQEEVVENYGDEPELNLPAFQSELDPEKVTEDSNYNEFKTIKEQIVTKEPVIANELNELESVASIIPSSVNKFVSNEEEYTEMLGDDLTRIEGIGSKVQDILKDVGIKTFRDIATTPLYRIKEYLRNAGPQFNMLDASTWTEQALLAAEGRWDELEVRQRELIGGREGAIEPTSVDLPKTTQNLEGASAVVAVESNLDNITEEMLEKVNKVKNAIRKAMSEKKEKNEIEKESDKLPTLDDVLQRNRKKGTGSFFDNID